MIYFLEFPYLKTKVTSGKTEVATDYAKHLNAKAEVTSGKAEVATDCAKHLNVKAEVTSGKAEVDICGTALSKDHNQTS